MSCLPYFNENLYAQPLFCTRPWFQGDCSFYEGAAYSVVPLYFYPRSYFTTPEFMYSPVCGDPLNSFVVASSFSHVTFNHGQRERNYWRCTTAAMNSSGIQALEKPKTICNPLGDTALVKSTEVPSSEKSRVDEVMFKMFASTDHSDASTTEQRGRSAENIDRKSKMLNETQDSEHAENSEMNISDRLQVGTSCSISSQPCYFSASKLNFPNENFSIFSSSLDGDLEVSYKKQRIPIANETDVNQVCTNIHIKDNQIDEHKCTDVDDDSQQEYHSAEEQDYINQSSSKKETDSSNFVQVKDLGNENVYAEDVYSTLACSSVVDSSSEIPEMTKSSQMRKCDQHCAKDSCLNFEEHKREQSVSMFYSIHNEDSFCAETSDSKPFLTCLTDDEEKVKTVSLSNVAISDMSAINTGLCKKADHSCVNALQKGRHLQVLSQGTTDLPYVHASTEDTEINDFCIYNQSVVSVVTANKDNCTPYLNNVASKNKVNQAVDASSDFRACFTTSRATNVKASVVSRSQNTMITMMNKNRPEEWLSVSHRSVACNTDWSVMYSNVEMTASPTAVEKSVGCSAAKNGRKSKSEDCVELNSRASDEIPNRTVQLSQTTSCLPCCCKELLQRAIKAEMQLLNIRCQKDHQRSWKTCDLDLEEKEYVSSSSLETRKSVMQRSLPQDADESSLPVVIDRMSGDENSALQPSSSSKDDKNDLVENSSLSTQEVSEDWFDAKENLTGIESSINLTENERKKDKIFSTAGYLSTQEVNEDWFDAKENLTGIESSITFTENERKKDKIFSIAETKTSKETNKESKNFYCVHVAGLSPSVSEIDLWLLFQRYQVSKVSICEYSSNYRYATLGFKAACDAKLAVKEMNEQEIKGKAVKVQLVKSIRESTVSNNQSFVKQDNESQRPHYSPENNIKNKNCNGILKEPPVSVTCKSHDSDSIFPSKGPVPSRDSLKSHHPVPTFPNVTGHASAFSKNPLGSLASPKNSRSDFKSSQTSSRNALLETDKKDIAENLMLQGSGQSSPHLLSATFIPQNALNLRSFRKVLKKLEELHQEINRDKILDALVEIKENKGSLSGLPLSAIVQMTSSLLNKKYASKLEEKPVISSKK